MKKIIILILGILILFGSYFLLQNQKAQDENSQITVSRGLEASNYSLIIPAGWSGTVQPNGPYGGPFVDMAVLRSSDFMADPEGNYEAAQQGAEIRIYSPFPAYPEYEDLSQVIDNNNRSGEFTEYSTVAGGPAMTYVWAYEGPVLLKTVFLKEKKLYTVTLQIAGAENLNTSAFDAYRPAYEKVLDSLRFK